MLRLEPDVTHRQAFDALASAGFRELARGDWSRVWCDPGGTRVARVSPFDPAYALHTRNCQLHRDNPYFQEIEAVFDLCGGGSVVLMERLGDAEEARASDLCVAVGVESHLATPASAATRSRLCARLESDPNLRDAKRVMDETAAIGRDTLGWFGGLDVRPANVMARADGSLVIVDPYFVDGRALIAAMQADVDAVAEHYTPEQLRSFLEIPPFDGSAADPAAVGLRDSVRDLCRRRGVPWREL